jgi:hypothetical protein
MHTYFTHHVHLVMVAVVVMAVKMTLVVLDHRGDGERVTRHDD